MKIFIDGKEYSYDELSEILINQLGISQETIDFATSIYGFNQETIDNIVYWKTGAYFNSLVDEEDEEEEELSEEEEKEFEDLLAEIDAELDEDEYFNDRNVPDK